MKTALESKLKQAGLPFVSVKVLGARSVHVRCLGRDTADKWQLLLATVFSGSKVRMVPTMWEASENKGTCLLPTMTKGFLIGVTA